MRIIFVFLWYIIGSEVLICIVQLSLQIWSLENVLPSFLYDINKFINVYAYS